MVTTAPLDPHQQHQNLSPPAFCGDFLSPLAFTAALAGPINNICNLNAMQHPPGWRALAHHLPWPSDNDRLERATLGLQENYSKLASLQLQSFSLCLSLYLFLSVSLSLCLSVCLCLSLLSCFPDIGKSMAICPAAQQFKVHVSDNSWPIDSKI